MTPEVDYAKERAGEMRRDARRRDAHSAATGQQSATVVYIVYRHHIYRQAIVQDYHHRVADEGGGDKYHSEHRMSKARSLINRRALGVLVIVMYHASARIVQHSNYCLRDNDMVYNT